MKKNLLLITTSCSTVAVLFFNSCGTDNTTPGIEFMPDMYRSPSYETYSLNPNFKDSLTARHPVAGTIPREYTFFSYPSSNEGYEAAGKEVTNPLSMTPENIAEGKRLYGIFCIHCHGEKGNADGSMVANGKFPPPPSYSTGKSSRGGDMKDLTDGKIFHAITYGINMMGSHASQLNSAERWKIVMYVRELQKAGSMAATTDSTAAKDATAKK